MRICSIAKDGGAKSTVTGLYLIEIKKLFSIVFLWFKRDQREVFHSHAFNALSWCYGVNLSKKGNEVH